MLAAREPRVLEEAARRASGGRCAPPTAGTHRAITAPSAKHARIVGSAPPVLGRLDDPVEQHGETRRSTAPRRPGRAAVPTGSFDVGMRKTPGEQADHDDRDVHEEDRAPVEVLEQEAAGERAEHAGEPGGAGPDTRSPCPAPRTGNTLVMIDSVAGMMNAPPMPMNARVAISCSRAVGERRRQRPDAEHHEAELQRAAPSEPVAEAAGGEQQAREHQRVAVDHPLQLAVAWRGGRARSWGWRR